MRPMLLTALSCTCLLMLSACAGRWTGSDYYQAQPVATEADRQVSGEALAQRKQSLRRVHRDLKSIHATAESLRRHRELEGIAAFEGFVHPYFREHVEPLLDEADGWHPELQLLQANLLFAQAAVLIELRDTARLSNLTRRIGKRFQGKKNLLIEYPLGKESTLEHALRDLSRGRGLL